jgi:hypothetical protein
MNKIQLFNGIKHKTHIGQGGFTVAVILQTFSFHGKMTLTQGNIRLSFAALYAIIFLKGSHSAIKMA